MVRASCVLLVVSMLGAFSVTSACGRSPERAHDSVVAPTTTSAATAAAPSGAKPACARTGHWSVCQVKLRLEAGGLAPQPDTTDLSLPELGGAPIRYMVGKSSLAVYLYADTIARSRAARSLDSAKFIAPGTALSMRGEATAIQNDNLLALLFSKNELQRERVSNAFLAGAPQP